MRKIDVKEAVEVFLQESQTNFAILIQGTFKENEQQVIVDFFSTPMTHIEPAIGYAMSKSDIFLKGVLGGINSEFEYYRQLENNQKKDEIQPPKNEAM